MTAGHVPINFVSPHAALASPLQQCCSTALGFRNAVGNGFPSIFVYNLRRFTKESLLKLHTLFHTVGIS